MTNKTNINKKYENILSHEWHVTEDVNRYSVTKLLSNVRESVLLERYSPTDEDVSDSFQAFIGVCVHEWLRNNVKEGTNEKKIEVKIDETHSIVGVIDRIENNTIIDYKVKKTSDIDISNAVKQIKMYAFLARKEGIVVDKGEVHVFRKDWSKMRNSDKPPIEVFAFDIDSFDIEWAENFVKEKILEFEKARAELPDCTEEEKWKQPDSWAVYAHKGDAKARRVFQTEDEAKRFAKDEMFVEHRVGKCIKCENFCKVKNLCKRLSDL